VFTRGTALTLSASALGVSVDSLLGLRTGRVGVAAVDVVQLATQMVVLTGTRPRPISCGRFGSALAVLVGWLGSLVNGGRSQGGRAAASVGVSGVGGAFGGRLGSSVDGVLSSWFRLFIVVSVE
jgi:hypothetical protein